MEWLTYFMIVLVAVTTCFGWPVLIKFEDSDGCDGSIGRGSGGSVPPNSDPPPLKDDPGGGIGGYPCRP
jgi:hypothetical protein